MIINPQVYFLLREEGTKTINRTETLIMQITELGNYMRNFRYFSTGNIYGNGIEEVDQKPW